MKHPSLYQLNTRVLLRERGVALGRTATLDDVTDAFLDEIAERGFEWVWPLGVWQVGKQAIEVSRHDEKLRASYREELPDLREEDILGSPFAIVAYEANPQFGGETALARFRERLARRSLSLLLDFVPNHTAPDHPWTARHPEYYVHGTAEDLEREPQNYFRVNVHGKSYVRAHGRDPYFDGWPDTAQLNYRHAGLREAMIAQLASIAERCDGVRADMAMLVQPDVFAKTWGDRALPADGSPPKDAPFWPEAIAAARRRRPGFLFLAEVYWGLEWELQQAGFDYTYDKVLYDRLLAQSAVPVRQHLQAEPAFRDRSLRFLENHDEPRAAATFPPLVHEAAAVIAFFVPGMRFFHEGQLEGRRVHVSMHLGRRPNEAVDARMLAFYQRLLACLKRSEVHDGAWHLWPCRPAWEGNPTHDQFIVSSWQLGERRLVTVVNYGPSQGQCYVTLGLSGIAGRKLELIDLMGPARYERDGDALAGKGLYLDLPAWGYHVFEVRITS